MSKTDKSCSLHFDLNYSDKKICFSLDSFVKNSLTRSGVSKTACHNHNIIFKCLGKKLNLSFVFNNKMQRKND